MSGINKNSNAAACDLGSLLEARDNALVILETGETQLVVHKSVLVTKSPVFATVLADDTVEADSGHIVIADVEPKVLQQLLLLMYKGSAPQLLNVASQLLVAADRYCLSDLKAQCEEQLIQDLSVENAMTSALLSLRYSCPRLKEAATCFLRDNSTEVMATEGWTEAVCHYPEEFVEVSHLVPKIWDEIRNTPQKETDRYQLNGFEWYPWHCLPSTEFLLAQGEFLLAQGEIEWTPLDGNINHMYSPADIKVLLDAGADIEAQDVNGRTALHYAAAKEDTESLLQAGTHMDASVSDSAHKSEVNENSRTTACDLDAFLEARDNALVTLVVGGAQLVVHRSVLVSRSPVFAAMLTHEMLEASSSRIIVSDMDPEVLQVLLLFMYKDSVPQICDMAPQLLVAADKYCVCDVKEQCELQLVEDLSVENVLKSTSLALRHSCPLLKKATMCFLHANLTKVMATKGWAEAVCNSPEEFVEFSRLIATKTSKLSVSGSENLSQADETLEAPAYNLDPPLEARDAESVTLVAGELQLVVQKSVLVARSTVFATMLAHDTVEVNRDRIVITDVEPKVLQQLVLFMYKDSAPLLCSVAAQLLVAADKYGVPDLKALCELQLAQDLSVENVMTSALLALRHSCPYLKKTAKRFLRANLTEVMGTEGWAHAVCNSPEDILELSRLVTTTPVRTRNESQKQMDQMLLKVAEYYRYSEMKQLLVSGAYIGAQDVRGRTALHIAAGHEFCLTTMNILLEAGADVEARDMNGRTALHYAAASGHKEETECLLKAGARVYVKDRWLNTPLHTAIQGHREQTVLLLLETATDVNVCNVYGNTPLHLAAQWGNRSVVVMLLRKGADKDSKNYWRQTPLDVAKKCNMKNLLDLLSKGVASRRLRR